MGCFDPGSAYRFCVRLAADFGFHLIVTVLARVSHREVMAVVLGGELGPMMAIEN